MKLSIIIPCYNCEDTLEEAINSIYTQNLYMSFEIIMVDDGSTDNTRILMQDLSIKHEEIRCIFHKKNKGGGATRNTAVRDSKSNVIFCLDSDDMLGKNALNNMHKLLIHNNLDGVSISKSIKFSGQNIDDIVLITKMDFINKIIPFQSLLDKSLECGLYSTFMHTRNAFDLIGGYPEDHGFDTQHFAFGFLANGLKAMASDNSLYYHRLSEVNNSYYNREYKKGKLNYNWYKIFSEFIYLFNDRTKEKILSFDIYENITKINILDIFQGDIYQSDYDIFLEHNSKNIYYDSLICKETLDKFEYYWLFTYEKKLSKKICYLLSAITEGLNFPYQYKELFTMIELSNNDTISDVKSKLSQNFLKQTLFIKVKNRLYRMFK